MELERLKLELEAKRLETAARPAGIAEEVVRRSARIARSPELPAFVDGRDQNQNQLFHYTRWITPKRVRSWRGPSPRHCAWATQLLSKKCRSGGEPLATLCPI